MRNRLRLTLTKLLAARWLPKPHEHRWPLVRVRGVPGVPWNARCTTCGLSRRVWHEERRRG